MKAFSVVMIIVGLLVMYNAGGRSRTNETITGLCILGIGIWLVTKEEK